VCARARAHARERVCVCVRVCVCARVRARTRVCIYRQSQRRSIVPRNLQLQSTIRYRRRNLQKRPNTYQTKPTRESRQLSNETYRETHQSSKEPYKRDPILIKRNLQESPANCQMKATRETHRSSKVPYKRYQPLVLKEPPTTPSR